MAKACPIAQCKSWVVHLETGPGDTLRLVQAMGKAVRSGTLQSPVLVVSTENGIERGIGLLSNGNPSIRVEVPQGYIVEESDDGYLFRWICQPAIDSLLVRHDATHQRLARALESLPIGFDIAHDVIHHVYLPFRKFRNRFSGVVQFAKFTLRRCRIDAPASRAQLECHPLPQWMPKKVAFNQPLRVLVFNRNMCFCSERNTPRKIAAITSSILTASACETFIAGNITGSENRNFRRRFSHATCLDVGGSYLEQIRRISHLGIDLAIGVNSGGLDLASVAGIPTLRVCEFQRMRGQWGKNYNSFLARALNVGMVPKMKPSHGPAHWFDANAFEVVLRGLLDLCRRDPAMALTGRHVVIRPSSFGSVQNFEKLLNVESVWP